MNDSDTIADLKQFIVATISQQTTDLQVDIVGLKDDVSDLKDNVKRVEDKLDDLSSAVATAIDASNEATGGQLKNHEQRITKLERQRL